MTRLIKAVLLVAALLLMSSMLAAQVQPEWWVANPAVPKGNVEERSIESKIYGHPRKIEIYTPPGYQASHHAPYGVLYFFDAIDYLNDIPLPTVLNNLIASGKIAPVVAVLVDTSENRIGDLANSERFARFIAEEVVPYARKNLHITHDASHTVVGGYSAGGLASAYIAYRYPELFGNVLSQSGAFWRGNEGASAPFEWLTTQYSSSTKKPLRFYLEVGGGETHRALGTGPIFIDTNRRLRDVLRSKGYEVDYREVPDAKHEPTHWRAALGDALIALTSGWKSPATLKATAR